jgi:hypothetical protein
VPCTRSHGLGGTPLRGSTPASESWRPVAT